MFRKSPLYKSLSRTMQNSSAKDAFRNPRLEPFLKSAIQHVPYYKKQYHHLLAQNQILLDQFDYLHKADIVNQEEKFVSIKYPKKLLFKSSTGGSTGISLNLYNSIYSLIHETFYTDYVFALINPCNKMRIAILRETKPEKGLFQYIHGKLILSQYDINPETVKQYLRAMVDYKINTIHAYPSSISILCKQIRELGADIEMPKIKGIITSSETISRYDKQLIMETFPEATLIDLYGQSEHLAMAYSINMGPYEIIHPYSTVEFRDTGLRNGDNTICEIIGTNLSNSAMPLIRYCTEDNVEIDSQGNILSIIGRTQDFLVNSEKELVPCIAHTQPATLKNVINFQYYQSKIGEIEYRIVVNEKFDYTDEKEIYNDLNHIFSGKIHLKIVVQEQIDRLPSGKQKRLIQELDLKAFH